jgi:hypothetical protein
MFDIFTIWFLLEILHTARCIILRQVGLGKRLAWVDRS